MHYTYAGREGERSRAFERIWGEPLDVCAGTNAIGIELGKREPTLELHAMDRSAAMQEVGGRRAAAQGVRLRCSTRRATCAPC